MKLKPLIPFEPILSDELPAGPQWVGQVKWDGVRMLTYYDGIEVKLFNRKLNERTFHYPELTTISEYCSAHSVILDGEIIALKNGKPSFYEVMKRDGITKISNINAARKVTPVTYMIFDLLYLNDRWVTGRALSERQKMLTEIISPREYAQLVENFADLQALYEVMQAQQMEGVVCKDITSKYLVQGKDGRWVKKKVYRDLIAVVGGVTFRDSIINSLLLGLFDGQGQLWYIGHAGTGRLSQQDWQDLTYHIGPLLQPAMPFINKPARIKGASWLKPEITVKVKFSEWIAGHTLRQPSIQAFVEALPEQCTFAQAAKP